MKISSRVESSDSWLGGHQWHHSCTAGLWPTIVRGMGLGIDSVWVSWPPMKMRSSRWWWWWWWCVGTWGLAWVSTSTWATCILYNDHIKISAVWTAWGPVGSWCRILMCSLPGIFVHCHAWPACQFVSAFLHGLNRVGRPFRLTGTYISTVQM